MRAELGSHSWVIDLRSTFQALQPLWSFNMVFPVWLSQNVSRTIHQWLPKFNFYLCAEHFLALESLSEKYTNDEIFFAPVYICSSYKWDNISDHDSRGIPRLVIIGQSFTLFVLSSSLLDDKYRQALLVIYLNLFYFLRARDMLFFSFSSVLKNE